MRKKLASLLFLIGFTSLFAAETIIERPPFSVANSGSVEVEKIILSDTATVMCMQAFYRPQFWIRIDAKTYIVANGKKLEITGSKGIELSKECFMDSTGRKSFTLYFPPIDPATKQIDFIESDCDNCFKIWGIELQSKTLTNRIEVPQEIIKTLEEPEENEVLEIPELKAGDALLKGQFLGYKPGMTFNVQLYVENPITDGQELEDLSVNEKGCFEIKVPLICSSQVYLRTNDYSKKILLTPGKETSVYFDLQKKYQQSANLRIDKCKPTNYIYFTGANASINNQLSASTDLYQSQKDFNQEYKDILGMTAEQYKSYKLKEYQQDINNLNQKGLSPRAFRIAQLNVQIKLMQELLFVNNNLETAFRKIHNLNYKDRLVGYIAPVIEPSYYSFLKESPLNDPISLYGGNLFYTLNFCQYLNTKKRFSLNIPSPDIIQKIIDTEPLTAEEKECANYLIKENHINWNKKRIANFKQSTLAYCDKLVKSDKLTADDKKEVDKLRTMAKEKKAKVADIMESKIALIYSSLKNNPDLSEEFLNSLETTSIAKQDTSMNKKAAAFTQKYGTRIQEMQREEKMKQSLEYLAAILGTNKGIAFDLIQAQQYYAPLNESIPLSDKTLQKISSTMNNPFYGEYFTNKNQELLSKIEANKNKKGYSIHETPTTQDDSLFIELLKPFKGKVILVDFWATWCSPCRHAMKEMEPAKEQFKGKDIAFVYLTDESSPLSTWKNMIPDIPGEHYRLTNTQFSYLRKKFGVMGVPSYLIMNKKGEQVYFKVGFEGANTMSTLLNQELSN